MVVQTSKISQMKVSVTDVSFGDTSTISPIGTTMDILDTYKLFIINKITYDKQVDTYCIIYITF